jgi:hypothetical protein
MRIIVPGGSRRLLAVASALVLLLSPRAARADEPTLVVRLLDGQNHPYPVTQIEQVILEDSTLSVVKDSGTDQYPMSATLRIDFFWNPSGVEDPEPAAAARQVAHLFQNQPNPFSARTRIGFQLPASGRAALKILAPDGRLIRTLLDQNQAAGTHEATWDGLDSAGRRLPSGIYFYELTGPGVRSGRKMIYLP